MSKSKKISDTLKLAIEFEKEGREYFLEAAKKTTHPLGQKMFKSLADDELSHMRKITEVYKSMEKDGSWPDMLPEPRTCIKTIFKDALENIDQEVSGTQDDIKVLEEAMKLEIKGNSFYHDLYCKAEGENEKEFFKFLAKTEADHFEILQNTKTFLESPADYYQEEERPLFEG